MRIIDIKSTIVNIPLSKPETWAHGIRYGATNILVEILTDEEIIGVGESCCAHPSAQITKTIIDSAKPFLLEEEPFDIERIMKKLYGIAGWHFHRHTGNWALSGIEMALWDIIGKSCQKPLYKLIGGKIRKKVPFMFYILREKPEKMVKEAERAVEQGFKTLYIKLGIDPISKEVELVKSIREAIGCIVNLRVDANEMWSPGTAIKNIRKLERYDLEFVEQPVLEYDLDGMAKVCKAVDVPICANQSSWTLYDIFSVIKKGAADIIEIDPRMAEGILGCKKAAGIAEAAGLPVCLHSNIEFGVATSANLHLVASTPNFLYANQTLYQFLTGDIIKGEMFSFKEGCLKVPENKGLGAELDIDKVHKYAEYYQKTGMYIHKPIKPEWIPLYPSF